MPVTSASEPPVGKIRGWKPQSLATRDGCLYVKTSIPASDAPYFAVKFSPFLRAKRQKLPIAGIPETCFDLWHCR
jgi:hypothetical protein